MISFIVWIVMGGIIGWIASMIMRTDAQQGPILNIVVGIVGSFIGGWLAGMFGFGDADLTTFDIPSLLFALLGAIVLLAIVNLFRRGSVR